MNTMKNDLKYNIENFDRLKTTPSDSTFITGGGSGTEVSE
jgi:hypothetical protein